ncbi:MAG: hypothetical protein ACQESN_10785 [Thermotogota bacterium]
MKKFLLLGFILVISFTIFASQEMMIEVLNHWNKNGVAYQQGDKYLSTEINDNIQVWLEKTTDSIIYVFYMEDIKSDDFLELVNTKSLPFSYSVQKDLINYLNDALVYFTSFGELPDLSYKSLGNYEYWVGIEYMLVQPTVLMMVIQ